MAIMTIPNADTHWSVSRAIANANFSELDMREVSDPFAGQAFNGSGTQSITANTDTILANDASSTMGGAPSDLSGGFYSGGRLRGVNGDVHVITVSFSFTGPVGNSQMEVWFDVNGNDVSRKFYQFAAGSNTHLVSHHTVQIDADFVAHGATAMVRHTADTVVSDVSFAVCRTYQAPRGSA